jgi:ketosteroid isomerase-like protein
MNRCKPVFALAMLCAWSACHAAGQDAAVLAPIHHFFDAFGKQDKSGMLAVAAPDVVITSVQQGGVRRISMDQLADAIVAHRGGPIAEHIHDPLVHVDHDLAVVWAPYTFASNGRMAHCGTDVFTLARLDGRWTIVGIADNERKGPCP